VNKNKLPTDIALNKGWEMLVVPAVKMYVLYLQDAENGQTLDQKSDTVEGADSPPKEEHGEGAGAGEADSTNPTAPDTPSEAPPANDGIAGRPGRLRRPLLSKSLPIPSRASKAKAAEEKQEEPKEPAKEPNRPQDIIARLRNRPRLNVVAKAAPAPQQGKSLEERRNSVLRSAGRRPGSPVPVEEHQEKPHEEEQPAENAQPEDVGQDVQEIKTSAIASTVQVSQSEEANPAPLATEDKAPEEAPQRPGRLSILNRLQSRKPGSLVNRRS
jgi:hypothetical protein